MASLVRGEAVLVFKTYSKVLHPMNECVGQYTFVHYCQIFTTYTFFHYYQIFTMYLQLYASGHTLDVVQGMKKPYVPKQRFDDCVSGQSKEITKVVHNLCYFFNFRKSATSFIGWLGQNNREYHSTSGKFY